MPFTSTALLYTTYILNAAVTTPMGIDLQPRTSAVATSQTYESTMAGMALAVEANMTDLIFLRTEFSWGQALTSNGNLGVDQHRAFHVGLGYRFDSYRLIPAIYLGVGQETLKSGEKWLLPDLGGFVQYTLDYALLPWMSLGAGIENSISAASDDVPHTLFVSSFFFRLRVGQIR